MYPVETLGNNCVKANRVLTRQPDLFWGVS